jgi:RimJ/RimL family protein N-acetyltransferase
MLVDHFPLVGLRLATPRLELRLPDQEELAELAELAAGGIHDAGTMPFWEPWTDQPPTEIARHVVRNHWQKLGAWSCADWTLDLAVFHDGVVVGIQSIRARDLAITREVNTGSWLGRPFQGKGIGTEMRAAVLHLAFEALGAQEATSIAFDHVRASLAVSRKLGYEPDGTDRVVVRGALTIDRRVRLTRAAWEKHRTVPVRIDGLTSCLPLLGIG